MGPVAGDDAHPEAYGADRLGNPAARRVFPASHADLLTPAFWQARGGGRRKLFYVY